jgi:hypothetical protein
LESRLQEIRPKHESRGGERGPSSAIQAWFHLLVPSVADLIFIILLATLSVGTLSPRLLGDAGIGWHIRNGQQILETHSITRIDSFSSTMSGQPWYAWEWLYDALIAGIHDALGLNGVVFLTALVIAATFALLFRFTLARGGSLPITVVLLALSVGASAIHLFARPHVLSWLFTLLWFHLLDSAETTEDHRVFWLPVVMLFWANLHGGFLEGFALLVLYLLAAAFKYLTPQRPLQTASSEPGQRQAAGRWLKKLGGVTVLSLLASLANPNGYKLHLHIYQYLSNRFLMNHIDEFASPNFHGIAQQCFAALLLITIVALASAHGRIRTSRLLVLIFAAYSGLYASRNLPVSSMLLTMIMAPILSQAIAEAGTNQQVPAPVRGLFSQMNSFSARMGEMEFRSRGHLWPVVAVILGSVLCFQHGRLGGSQVMNAHFDEKRFPVQATEVIVQRDIHEPIFAPDYWGGFLIYCLYPQTKVFVDDRHDLYGEQFLKDYLKAIQVAPDWEAVLRQKQVNWVLVPTGSSLANMLKETGHWNVIHEDGTAALFQRAS